MTAQAIVQQWTEKYNDLVQKWYTIKDAIQGSNTSTALALNEAKRLKLRLEYQVNQHIESAYTAEMLDVYNTYQSERFTQLDNVPIDGILYNNTGQALIWDSNSSWGFYNELREVRNFVRASTDYIVASSLQAQKANISALFNILLGEALNPGDNIFNTVKYSPNPYLQKMAVDTLSILLGKEIPVNTGVGNAMADTIYEFFYGSYDPSFYGLELPPSLLQNVTEGFFQNVEDFQIEQAISQLSLNNTVPFSLLDLFKQTVDKLDIRFSTSPQPTKNPTIFDLTTDTIHLRPEDNAPRNSATDNWGLLQSGAGWQAKMVSNFVNDNGLVNTSGSNIVAESRIGNVSPNDTVPLVDGVRAFNFDDRSSSTLTAITIYPGQTSSESSTVSFTLGGVQGNFTGIIHYDAHNNPIAVTPDAGQNVTVKLGDGQEVILDGSQDLVFSPDQTQNTDGSYNLAGWFLVDPQNSAYQLKLSKLAKNIAYTDPLSLDSGNDGIRFSAQPGNFDLDSDGVAESIRWISPADPLLVLDANHDGRINNGSELVDLTGTANQVNLLSLDSNGDGILNAADGNAFTDLQLWQDRNQDGYASTEERQTLTDVGITSIELNPVTDTVAGIADVQGVIAHKHSFNRISGTVANDAVWKVAA